MHSLCSPQSRICLSPCKYLFVHSFFCTGQLLAREATLLYHTLLCGHDSVIQLRAGFVGGGGGPLLPLPLRHHLGELTDERLRDLDLRAARRRRRLRVSINGRLHLRFRRSRCFFWWRRWRGRLLRRRVHLGEGRRSSRLGALSLQRHPEQGNRSGGATDQVCVHATRNAARKLILTR